VQQPIVGFHRDEQGDWVADLACGHGQHVRHQPPFMSRLWVLTHEGRQHHIGEYLRCKKCDERPSDDPP
jgi:cytochrome c-type biogenesis protein CcmH/NrfF